MKYVIGFFISTVLCLTGCTNHNVKKVDGTYLGGEIVNPRTSAVVIAKNDVAIDTVLLDSRNRFFYEFKNFEPGLYNFLHWEGQMIFLEEGDSILLRVNTKDFDESLSFTGIGAEKNNFLIDLFLKKEEEDRKLTYLYQKKDPRAFENSLDSLLSIRKNLYKKFKERQQVSSPFDNLISSALKIDNCQRKEQYPFSHYSKNKFRFIENLPDNFYSFRESFNYNNKDLVGHYGYINYLENYFNHQSFLQYGKKHPYNTFSFVHNISKIKIIDSVVSNPDVKDRLLRSLALRFIANNNNMEKTDQIYAAFDSACQKQSTKNRVNAIYMANKKMRAGNVIPDQILVDVEGRLVTLSNVIQKPTVIYFWSYDHPGHMQNAHTKSKDLRSKYPDFDFIGINWNNDIERWKSKIKAHKSHLDREYQFKDFSKALRDLAVLNPQSRTLILNADGTIYNSHSNLYQVDFENELLAYLNQ